MFGRVRAGTFAAFQHQEVPFEAVVEALGVRSTNQTPLFQVLLVMHAYLDARAFEGEAFRFEVLGERPAVAKYDLGIDVNPGASGAEISIEYARDMFEEATVVRLGSLWRRLLLAAVAAPETAVQALPLLEAAERAEVVEGFNATAADYPRDRTMLDLFEARSCARRRPSRWSMASIRRLRRAGLGVAPSGAAPDRAGGGAGDGGGGVRGALGGADRGPARGVPGGRRLPAARSRSIRRSGWGSCWPTRRRRWC